MPVVDAVDVEVEGVVGHLQQVAERVEQQDPHYLALICHSFAICPNGLMEKQCCGSGCTCFWAFWIRIH